MTVLSDKTIREYCEGTMVGAHGPMIEPFHGSSVKEDSHGKRIASYGLSSGGYDLRAGTEFKVFKSLPKFTLWQRFKAWVTGKELEHPVLDYKNISADLFDTVYGDKVVVPPGGFLLTHSKEYVRMPRNVIAMCIGKSTIARAGWNCLCTPIEPGWEGHITFEFQNTTNRPNVFYAHEGVLQLVFHDLDQDCETSYADRGGKYMKQADKVILPRV